MSHWNHRVMRHVEKDDAGGDVLESIWYAIHEVYYDAKGNVDGWTAEPAYPVFYPEEDDGQITLKDDVARFARACDKPILDFATGKEIES